MKELVIFGAWYFSRVVAEAAEASGWKVLGYVDPDPPQDVATLSEVPDSAEVFVAIGDNAVRESVARELRDRGRRVATVIHPAASVSPSARLGEGCYIAEMAVLRTNAALGAGVVLQPGSVVSHDAKVDDFASFGPNAACASKVRIGRQTTVGVGASIAPGVHVGHNCTVAAGAVVFRDCEGERTLVGNPAKPTRAPRTEAVQSNWSGNTVW